jgi:hypothetical protein
MIPSGGCGVTAPKKHETKASRVLAGGPSGLRATELEAVHLRLTNAENAWTKSQEEADAFCALTTTSLGELLDTHRELKTDEDRFTRGHAERVQAVKAEVASLRVKLKDATKRLEDSHGDLVDEQHKERARMPGSGFTRVGAEAKGKGHSRCNHAVGYVQELCGGERHRAQQ